MIAFQGESGAFSEAAALAIYGENVETLPCVSFEAVFHSVGQGDAEYGLIPIENSLAGSIHRNYDLLLRNDLTITAEYQHRIEHCLLALPGVELSDIRHVMSHPQALAQCERFLASLPSVEIVSSYDTAGSARIISEGKERDTAAIASRRAAEVYGMRILAEGIEDDPANFTRFLILGTETSEPGAEAKTSIVFTLENRPGALYEALASFANRGIDLTKIESRPLVGKPWEYIFYMDHAGEPGMKDVGEALDELEARASSFRILGSYPKHRREASEDELNSPTPPIS